jgi:hypothetical protein
MRLLVLPLLLFPCVIFGQIQFTAADLPQPGDTLFFAVDNNFPVYTPVAEGSDLLWDFSGLYPSDVARNIYLSPDQTPFAGDFPESNLALRIDFDSPAYSFFTQDSSQVVIDGLTADIELLGGAQLLRFEDPQKFTDIPTVLGTEFKDTAVFEVAFQEPTTGADLLLRSHQVSEIITDGSGELILPGGTFSALRQKVISHRVDSLFIVAFGNPIFFDDMISEDTLYLWISPAAKGIILNTDFEGNWTYYAPELANLTAPRAALDYTVATDTSLQFMDTSTGTPFTWNWDFGDGNTSTARNPLHVYDSTGTYEVCLRVDNAAGSDSVCQMVSVVITDLDNFQVNQQLQVFPNPASDQIQFVLTEPVSAPSSAHPNEAIQLDIFAATGQLIERHTMQQQLRITTHNWQPSVYYYRLSYQGQVLKAGNFIIK